MRHTRFSPRDVARSLSICMIAVAAGLLVSPLRAADDDARPKRQGEDFRKRLLEEFDADKDGRLDKTEQAKAREAMAKRRGGAQGLDRRELMKKFDKDGDGRLSDEERKAAMQARGGAPGGRPGGASPADRRELMKRFDKNGDGTLNEAERAALRKAIAGRRGDAGTRPKTDRPKTDRPDEKRPGGAGPDARRAEVLKRFDKDGDGKLSDTERAAAKAAFENRRGAPGARPAADKPDTGRVDKQALLKEFDADGDGKLNGAERAAARKAMEDRKRKNAKE